MTALPCWYVHVRLTEKPRRDAGYIVAAFTERSAKVQTRKRVGSTAKILDANPVAYAHAWRIDFAEPYVAASDAEPE